MCGMPCSVRLIVALSSFAAAWAGAARRPGAPVAGSAAPAPSARVAATPASSLRPLMAGKLSAGPRRRAGGGRSGRGARGPLALYGEQRDGGHARVHHVVGGLVQAALAVVRRRTVGVAAHVPLAVLWVGAAREAEVHEPLRVRLEIEVAGLPVHEEERPQPLAVRPPLLLGRRQPAAAEEVLVEAAVAVVPAVGEREAQGLAGGVEVPPAAREGVRLEQHADRLEVVPELDPVAREERVVDP